MPWDSVHPFHCPTRLFYGRGASAQAGERLRELGVTKALLVSDRGLEAAGTVATITGHIRDAGVEVTVYTETEPNPTTTNVHDAAALYEREGCDGIVGLGGGSSMDCAKGAGIIVRNGGWIGDYRGVGKVQERVPPLVCIPTTCGTGSEATAVAVITDPDDDFKLVIVGPSTISADVGLVDPELVLSAPASVVAATGIDALAHAIESFVNRGSDPLLDAINIGAIRMIGQNLRAAVAGDPEALAQTMLASMMAGIAFNMNANAIVHAASTPVTARHHVPHGVANGIFLAPGLAAISAGCRPQLAAIADALGEDVSGLPLEEAAERGIQAVRALCADIGIPATLREWGLAPEQVDIPQLVDDAMKSRNIVTNPVPIGPPELEDLYRVVVGL